MTPRTPGGEPPGIPPGDPIPPGGGGWGRAGRILGGAARVAGTVGTVLEPFTNPEPPPGGDIFHWGGPGGGRRNEDVVYENDQNRMRQYMDHMADMRRQAAFTPNPLLDQLGGGAQGGPMAGAGDIQNPPDYVLADIHPVPYDYWVNHKADYAGQDVRRPDGSPLGAGAPAFAPGGGGNPGAQAGAGAGGYWANPQTGYGWGQNAQNSPGGLGSGTAAGFVPLGTGF